MRSKENPTLSEIYIIVNNFNDYMLFNFRGVIMNNPTLSAIYVIVNYFNDYVI